MGGRIEFGTLWNTLRNSERGVEVTELLKGEDEQELSSLEERRRKQSKCELSKQPEVSLRDSQRYENIPF